MNIIMIIIAWNGVLKIKKTYEEQKLCLDECHQQQFEYQGICYDECPTGKYKFFEERNKLRNL